MRKSKVSKKPIKRRVYKSNERRERMRIYELYDGPTTDMQAAIRTMNDIHKWIKEGAVPPKEEIKIRPVATPR